MKRRSSFTIVAEDRFILATRDTGYRSTAAAVAELVDNSIQAGASFIRIRVTDAGHGDGCQVAVAVLDDGSGMDSRTLREALRFGGTERFGNRCGQGRFGMGLPNSSVSQARRVDIYSWTRPSHVYSTYLDV